MHTEIRLVKTVCKTNGKSMFLQFLLVIFSFSVVAERNTGSCTFTNQRASNPSSKSKFNVFGLYLCILELQNQYKTELLVVCTKRGFMQVKKDVILRVVTPGGPRRHVHPNCLKDQFPIHHILVMECLEGVKH